MKKISLLIVSLLMAVGAIGAELNIYASGLRNEAADASNNVQISYFLNAPATSLNFQLINSSKVVAKTVAITDASLLTKGQHVTAIDLHDALAGTYTWALEATGAANASLTEVTTDIADLSFYGPRGVAVDNSTESDYLGRVYVANGANGASDGHNTAAKTSTVGLFLFNADLSRVTSQGVNGLHGGVSWAASGWGPSRMAIDDAGYVFICNNGLTSGTDRGVYMMDPANPTSNFTEVLDHSKLGTVYTRPNSLSVVGTGAERVLYVNDYTDAIVRFPVGNSFPYSTRPSKSDSVVVLTPLKIANAENTIVRDRDGGFWVSQKRSQLDTYPELAHITSSGVIDYQISSAANSSLGLSTANRGVVALNVAEDVVAFAGGGTVSVLKINKTAGGISLTLLYSVPSLGTNVDGIAFDRADNIYIVGASKERLRVYATPKSSNTCITPAASSRTITLAQLVSVVPVTGVSLDKTSATIKKTETVQLNPTVLPVDATDKMVLWSSDNTTVATVSATGLVTGMAPGTAVITATTSDGSFTATCNVTVEGTIAWNLNGGTPVLRYATKEALYDDWCADYKAIRSTTVFPAYSAVESDPTTALSSIYDVTYNTTDNVKTLMTSDKWSWLGGYISGVSSFNESTDESSWRSAMAAFFTNGQRTTWPTSVSYASAGLPTAYASALAAASAYPTNLELPYVLPTPVRDGYDFLGWEDAGGNIVTTVTENNDYTFSARWIRTMAGTYTVGTSGDYASLHAACVDINAQPIQGDVTLLIASDLTETENTAIQNPTNYTITIRPDADADRTITYKTGSDNVGPSGNFVIGGTTTGRVPFSNSGVATKNIIVDGAAEDYTTRRLEIVTNTAGGCAMLIYGDVTNTVVRNCKIRHTRASGTNSALVIRSEKASDNHPVDVVVENCYLETLSGSGQCVILRGDESATAAGKPENTTLRNCEIKANLRGVFLNGAINANFEGCTFRMVNTLSGYVAHGIMGNVQTGTINVKGCRFVELSTKNISKGAYGIHGITASGGATVWKIENNYFAGLDATEPDAASKAIEVVAVRAGDPCVVRHNTFVMPSLTNHPTTALVTNNPIALLYLAGTNNTVQNNIFVSNETTSNNSLIRGNLKPSDVGNVFYHAGGNAAIVAGDPVCADYATFETSYPTQAAASKWVNVQFVDVANGDLALTGVSDGDVNLGVTRLAEVLTDIEGTTRADFTYAGAYEATELVLSTILTLDETADNRAAISGAHGETVDVNFVRSFDADGFWYTLCLPFDMDESQMTDAFGAGYTLAKLVGSDLSGDVLHLGFDKVTMIEAGVPYLFMPGTTVANPTIEGVTIDATASTSVATEHASMTGFYLPTVVASPNLFLGANNYLLSNSNATATKAFRAYFTLDGSVPAGVRARVVMNGQTATDLDELEASEDTVQKIFRNGAIYIIREGRIYTAQGQLVE